MHQNIKEYNLINSIINNRRFEETTISKEGPQLLLENDDVQMQRETEDAKQKAKIAKEAENRVLQRKIRKNEEEIREDSEGGGMSDDEIKEKIAELTERISELRKQLDKHKNDDEDESIDEDCPHTEGHDHNEDYCAMVKSQLGKLSQMSGMIASMIPKDTDLPEGVKEKISAAMSNLSGAAAAMQSSALKQDDEQGSNQPRMQPRPTERRITTFNVRPVSAPSQRMAGFSFNPPSTQNYEEYND